MSELVKTLNPALAKVLKRLSRIGDTTKAHGEIHIYDINRSPN
jgi:hypothetical protein